MVILWLSSATFGPILSAVYGTIRPMDRVFMSIFNDQSMSIGCVGKFGHLSCFLWHYLLLKNSRRNHSIKATTVCIGRGVSEVFLITFWAEPCGTRAWHMHIKIPANLCFSHHSRSDFRWFRFSNIFWQFLLFPWCHLQYLSENSKFGRLDL